MPRVALQEKIDTVVRQAIREAVAAQVNSGQIIKRHKHARLELWFAGVDGIVYHEMRFLTGYFLE